MIFSANRNYESRVLFPERSSSDRGKRRDFCFDRFVQRHGFAGISALAGACFACPRRTWRDRILLFQRGQFGGSFGAFFRRFGCSQPRGEEKTTTEGVGSEQRCERSPDAIVPESAVVSADPVPDDRILENALATVYEYTDKDLGDAVDGTNRQILRRRLLYLACMAPVPNDVPQVRLRHDRVSYGDLCHYGWNVWNAFKGATNRFYDQTELAEWPKASFESLAKYNTKTLRAKLRATDGGYRIRLIDNLKEYIQK